MKQHIVRMYLLCMVMLCGVGTAWGQTQTVLYERGYETAWSAADIAEWGNNSATINAGLQLGNTNAAFEAKNAIQVENNSIVKFSAVYNAGVASGRDSSYDYLKIGGVELRLFGQGQYAQVVIDGVVHALTGFRRGADYIFSVTINQASGEVAYNVSGGAIGEGNGTTVTPIEGVAFGHYRGGRENYAVTTILKQIKVSEEIQTVATADYTINYIFNEEIIKTDNGNLTVGTVVNAISPITIEGQKYYATSATSLTIDDDVANNILNVVLRKAYDYTYSILSSTGKTLASGTQVEDENITIAVPRYINVDGTLYETAKNGTDWYHHTYTIKQNNQVETVTYNATGITNVVLYAEAEELSGASQGSGGVAPRVSMGLVGYGTNLPVTTLPSGAYKIYMHTANGNASTRAIEFKTGDVTIVEGEMGASNNNQDFNDLSPFTLLGSADITLTAEGSSASGVDYFYIVKDDDNETVSYTVNYEDENGQSIKDPDTFEGIVGTKIFVGSVVKMLEIDGEKYYYDSDDIGERTVVEGDVVTIKYHKEKDFHYTVKSNMGTDIASGVVKEKESVVISYPEHILVDRTLYTVRNNTGGEGYYRVRITPNRDNYEYTINYDGEQVSNVVFYTEAEEIAGVSLATNEARASLGQMAYTPTLNDYKEVTLLQPGVYRIYLHAINGETVEKTAIFKVGDRQVYETRLNASNTFISRTSEDIYVDSESSLSFVCEGSNLTGIDNIYIQYLRSFEPVPVYTLNLRKNNGAIADVQKTLSVRADNAQYYTWYSADTEDGVGTLVQEAKTMEAGGNIFSFTRGTSASVIYYYCIATGYSGIETKSVVTKVVTVNERVSGAWVDGYRQDYESAGISDWISQNATAAIESHDGSRMIGVNGETANALRTAYLPLTDNLKYMTPDHVTNDWGLSYDFYPVNMDMASQQAIQIYKENTAIGLTNGMPGNNALLDNANCFVSLVCNNNDYLYSLNVAGSDKTTVTLQNDQRYHMDVKVVSGKISVDVSDASGANLCTYTGDSPFAENVLLGGIMYVLPRRNNKASHAYFDNITLKVMTTDLAINSDLPDFSEGNDDYYLNDGEGLNFDVPAATQFEWYVSAVAPEEHADGTTAPKLNADGSITWNGQPFMTVKSPVGRATTEIATSGKNAVEPTDLNEGKYAWGLQQTYGNVKTVYDEATVENAIYRYYPEATASGSRWHYLRQIDPEKDENEHIDYVWCVASNALGTVTSSVAQVITYPLAPQIFLADEYETENLTGLRADLTLPGIYKFRNTKVEISANNLIFNTTNKPVPYATKSIIQYKDAGSNLYAPTTPQIGPGTEWKHDETVWPGMVSTTNFSSLDGTLEGNASVHGYYKSIPMNVPINFSYGLMQIWNPGTIQYDEITNGAAEYVIGPAGNTTLQAVQDIYVDYGRRPATELGAVSTKTTWDWSTLPERPFLTYNQTKYTTSADIAKYLYTIPRTDPAQTYVVDPETGLGGPEMGQEYVMADFYGYSTSELDGFPSDKVKLGLEYVNSPTEKCMQGNAFIIKPTEEGTLTLLFSTTDSGEERYLTLNYDDKTVSYKAAGSSSTFSKSTATTIKMAITAEMLGKEVKVKACKSSGDTPNQYFRIYSATYTPDSKPVNFTEWIVDERSMSAAGGVDTYTALSPSQIESGTKSDGYVSISTATNNAVIKYKIVEDPNGDLTDDQIAAKAVDIEHLDAEEFTYVEDVYIDTKGNKIGIHCRVNSVIFAWTEAEGMNRSDVTAYRTHAEVYPVDLRFMYNFDTSTINTQPGFDAAYWDEKGTTHQSDLATLIADNGLEAIKNLSTTDAPKPWKATANYGSVTIDGLPYTAANFDKFFITHGTTIDIYVNPDSKYKFNGWGAPSFSTSDNKVVDMMRSGAKAKHVHYHLLYDKAKAATTAGVAFLIANFTDRTEPLKAQVYVKEGDGDLDDDYKIDMQVSADDKIVAPVYHTAHKDDGFTVMYWTDDYRPAENKDHYEDYTPGVEKKIYEDALIKPVYRENTIADNFRSRSAEMKAEWWFTTDHYAQVLNLKNEYAGFNMPYVAPVRRHQIGTATEGAEDDLWFDLPMTITPGNTGRLDNTVNADWCAVGRGLKFTVPACPGAEVSMEVRSKLSLTSGGTTFGGQFPTLWKVKYQGETDYTETATPESGRTVESYVYKYTYTGTASELDIVLGNDYSYLRHIGVTMPVITHNRDAALVTLNFSELFPHLTKQSFDFTQPEDVRFPLIDSPVPYGDGETGDGYDFDHKTENVSLYRTHYSKEHGAIYYDGVSRFMVVPGQEVADNVPYVNGILGYTSSTGTTVQGQKISSDGNGTFIVGPFRSITHIRYLQGCSVIGGGGWTMQIGRMNVPDNWKNYSYKNGKVNDPDDPRREILDFSRVTWGEAKYGSIHNSTTPEWVEMDIEEHIYPEGKNNSDLTYINDPDYDQMQGDIFLRFKADKPDVYLFAIEIYGIDPTSDQQVTLETGVLAAQKDDDTTFEPSLRAGSIFHYPYLLQLDDKYEPISSVKGSDNKIMQYNEGREVSLTANASQGYEFLKWVKPNGSGGWEDVSTENPYTFNINEDTDLRAVFVHRGIINYITSGTNYGHAPEMQQTDAQGGFYVAENRGMFSAEGMSLRQWQDSEPLHEWYEGEGRGKSTLYNVSTNTTNADNTANVTTPSHVDVSRAITGIQVDVFPQFSANTLSLLDVTGRKGATARWQFGKKNGAPTMSGTGTTSHLVTQIAISNTKSVSNPTTGEVTTEDVSDVIDVRMGVNAAINNAGRGDIYATVSGTTNDSYATYTLPATKGMKIEIGAQGAIQYRLNDGEWLDYTEAFPFYSPAASAKLELKPKDPAVSTIELEYIQATYFQRAQTPVLSMQKVDVVGDHPTNNIQVQVQTNSNKNAIRFYTTDGTDPQFVVEGNTVKPLGSTMQVRSNYITINESQILTGNTLKVISVCPDRADSEIATLDLVPYNPALGLATYVYDSRFIDIHEDQIFKKLMDDHEGHFNLLSYDLNPNAAVIPEIITNNTTVFVTSDAVREHLMTALTDPSDPAAHGQKFTVQPLIVGTPLYVYWNAGYDNEGNIIGTVNDMKDPSTGGWLGMSWQNNQKENADTPTSPATITYYEYLRGMKTAKTRVDTEKTYEQYYADQITAAGGKYILAFYDNMLLYDGKDADGNTVSQVCISNTTSNAPEDLSHNGTQLVFNATELLTRPDGNGHFANVKTFNDMILALMAPTKNPQLVNVALTPTQDVIDLPADAKDWVKLDAMMLSALSDGTTVMTMPYLASSYSQFRADAVSNYGQVNVTNIKVADPEKDDLATAEKLGAQGVKDLATTIELTDPNNDKFKRTYRIEYNIPLEEITFHKNDDGTWSSNDANNLWSLEEINNVGQPPFYKVRAPQNFGIKDVCFNGYAVAPDSYFDDSGEIKGDLNPDGTPKYSVWGRGEKYDAGDTFTSPTSYNVITPMIPEYPESSLEADRIGLGDQWMVAEFPWGFKDCEQMAFSLTNINKYVGEIKVKFYRRQAESPKLISATVGTQNLKDDVEIDPSGQIRLEFNSVMHEVRKPGRYTDLDVDWTVHIIPEDIASGVKYSDIKDNFSQVDAYDVESVQQRLTSEGGSNVLTFHYWRLEEGKKYWLHIPFHILRGAVGTGTPYVYPTEVAGTPEENMSWTNYSCPKKDNKGNEITDTEGNPVLEYIPYFDIPFTVKPKNINHRQFDYIVNNDNWWKYFKESGSATCAGSLPTYATWDGDFSKGINEIKNLQDGHDRFYMHVQKNKDASYTYSGKDDYHNAGLIQIHASNFSITGEGSDSTMITAEPEVYGDDADYSGLTENNNKSTFHIDGSKVYIQDVTLQNTQQGTDKDGQEYPALYDHGDRNVFYGVNIDGYEESFAVFGTLSYLEKCRVSGFGDFIVGSGDVWLDSCNVVLRNRQNINLCAPSTKEDNKWGFVFNGCTIDREAGAGKVLDHNWTLARPWDGYDTSIAKSPSVNFINTEFKVLPTQGGYGALSEGLRLRFHEYGSKQNGLDIPLTSRSIANCNPAASSDYPVITAEQTEEYTVENVFGHGTDNGYDPQALTKQAKAPTLVNDGMVLHWKADKKDLCYLVYYLGDGENPDWDNAMMFCCVPGTNDAQAYCYLTNHDISPIFRTGGTDRPIAFSELWYGKRKVNGSDEAYNDNDIIDGMGKGSPSRLWFAVRAANQMGGLSPMSNALMYHAARQYRTTIKMGGKQAGDETSGNAYSTIYLDFQALAPKGVKAYALTEIGEDGDETALTFTRMSDSDDENHQDVIYANQGYLIYGPYTDDVNTAQDTKNHVFIETTSMPDNEDLVSLLSGTVGIFKDNVSEPGYGELDGENGGWSIAPVDYDDVQRVNVSAFTLQKYNNLLGFYKFTGTNFAHHRGYLDTGVAAKQLMTHGMSQDDAMGHLSRGIKIIIHDTTNKDLGVTTIVADGEQKDAVYDLMGKRINRKQMLPGQIYIVGGKKVLYKP